LRTPWLFLEMNIHPHEVAAEVGTYLTSSGNSQFAMKHGPFTEELPNRNCDFPWLG
jgi:hypothetical protein